MGTCKDNLTTKSDKKTSKSKNSIMERVSSKIGRRRKQLEENKPEKFVECIELADEKLTHMILAKNHDLETEDSKSENQAKLAILETMGFHLDKIAELCLDYQELLDVPKN